MIAASMSAFAAAADKVSVTFNDITEGNTLKLYKVAAATVAADNTLSFTMTSGLPEAYDEITEIQELGKETATEAQVKAMADAYGAFFGGKTADFSQAAGSDKKATVSVDPGYYFAIISGDKDTSVVYKNMLVDATPVAKEDGTYDAHAAINREVKKENITITKTEPDPTTTAATAHTTDGYYQGDKIPFTITTTIPNYPSTSTHATFVITDTPNGVNDIISENFVVKVDGQETAATSGDNKTYTVETKAAGNYNGFTVTFDKYFILAHAGKSVVVTYEGTLDAPINLKGGTSNTADITYNPNPFEETTVKPGDTDEQYQFGLVVFKYEEKADKADKSTKLPGAEFELYESKAKSEEDTTLVIDETKKVRGATATNGNGLLSWDGLKSGTYFLKETKAPAGYTKITDPIQVVVTKNTATGDNKMTADKTEEYFLKVEVPNEKGQSLPETEQRRMSITGLSGNGWRRIPRY